MDNFKKILPNGFIIRDVIIEITIILLFTTLPIIILFIIKSLMISPAENIYSFISQNYKYSDTLNYSIGILASTTTWFMINPSLNRHKPRVFNAIIALTPLLIFFAALVYIQDVNQRVQQNSFTENYVKIMLILSFLLWFFSLYHQKCIFTDMDIEGKKKSNNIIEQIESKTRGKADE